MTSDDIVAGADARIAAHRTADVSLTLRDPGGNRLPAGLVASVEQVRHEFLFGCNTYSWGRCGTPDGDRAYADRFSALFNYATLPFYWGPVPPTRNWRRMRVRRGPRARRPRGTWPGGASGVASRPRDTPSSSSASPPGSRAGRPMSWSVSCGRA